jgi:hypothetical protein
MVWFSEIPNFFIDFNSHTFSLISIAINPALSAISSMFCSHRSVTATHIAVPTFARLVFRNPYSLWKAIAEIYSNPFASLTALLKAAAKSPPFAQLITLK